MLNLFDSTDIKAVSNVLKGTIERVANLAIIISFADQV